MLNLINLGMRFALLEVKLILVRVLQMYNVNLCSNTPDNIEFVEGFLARRPKNEIPVLLTKRDNFYTQ